MPRKAYIIPMKQVNVSLSMDLLVLLTYSVEYESTRSDLLIRHEGVRVDGLCPHISFYDNNVIYNLFHILSVNNNNDGHFLELPTNFRIVSSIILVQLCNAILTISCLFFNYQLRTYGW